MSEDLLTQPQQSVPSEREASFHDALLDATPVAFVTPALMAINVLVFVLMSLRGVPFLQPGAEQVLPWGANFGPLTAGGGQWWRLLTACFLHFGIMHIAVNMYILWQVGVFTERLFGNLRYAVLYLLAGFGGNIAGLFFHPFAVGAGASGAIFGVYGGLLGFLLIERGVVPGKAASGIAKSAGVFVLYNLVAGFARPETDQVAHIGGIVTGFLVGCALARPLGVGSRHLQIGRAAVVSAVFAAVGVFAVRHLPAQSPGQVAWYRSIMTGKSVMMGQNNRVVYTGSATPEDAQRVGKVLQRLGLQKGNSVVLFDRSPSGATLWIPLRADDAGATTDPPAVAKPSKGTKAPSEPANPEKLPWNNPASLVTFQIMGPEIASAGGGPPLTLRLLNSKGEPQRSIVIRSGEVAVGTRDRVAYSGVATAAQAAALGTALQAGGFLRDRGTVVLLARESASKPPVVALFLTEGGWENAGAVSQVAEMVKKAAPALGGPPVGLALLDGKGQTRKQVLIQ